MIGNGYIRHIWMSMCMCVCLKLNQRLCLLSTFSNPKLVSSHHCKVVNNICISDVRKVRLRSYVTCQRSHG